MVYTVLKIKKEGRKKFPEAVCAFLERYKAENFLQELIDKGEDPEDVWVEPGFPHTMVKHPFYGFDCEAISDNSLGDVVYPIWHIESRRDACGIIHTVLKTEQDTELYKENEWPLYKDGFKGLMVLNCKLVK